MDSSSVGFRQIGRPLGSRRERIGLCRGCLGAQRVAEMGAHRAVPVAISSRGDRASGEHPPGRP